LWRKGRALRSEYTNVFLDLYVEMSLTLLIETATPNCSVALAQGELLVAVQEVANCSDHAAVLPTLIAACLREAGVQPHDLSAVAVSAGPGSYSSLRVGVSLAKGVCYATGCPLVAIDTLESMAWGARLIPHTTLIAPMLDARRSEVWLSLYDVEMQCLAPAQPLIIENNSFEKWILQHAAVTADSRITVVGSGAKKIEKGSFGYLTVHEDEFFPSARHLTVLAQKKIAQNQFENLAYFEPFYMKPPNITTPRPTPLKT
jgi:tRNA threonylcarbamoyladenosine biosynthesis protein TsaB